jgi:hypothetical protein
MSSKRRKYPSYKTGQPYDVLIIGEMWFLPWMEAAGSNKTCPKTWHLDPDSWRSPGGRRMQTSEVLAWAKSRDLTIRRHFHTPKVIDEDELLREETILYGPKGGKEKSSDAAGASATATAGGTRDTA